MTAESFPTVPSTMATVGGERSGGAAPPVLQPMILLLSNPQCRSAMASDRSKDLR